MTKRWLAACLSAVTAAVAAAGCSSGGTGPGTTGTIAITLNPTSATIQQGASADVAATLTRGGGFGGVVTITVEGVPTGVTGTVSNATTTSATITISVAATTVPGTYNLTVRGKATSVTDATAAFTLTVTATPAFTLTLTPAALSIVQGANAPTTVNIGRTNFTAGVNLTVENAPAGVTAAFNPTPATGATSVLTLTVASTVVPGVYNLTVRGVAASAVGPYNPTVRATSAPPDQTAALTLTVTAAAASYTLSLAPAALTIAQGANGQTIVTITRINFAGAVTFSLGGAPAGVAGVFNPAAPTGTASTLTVTVGAAVAPGVYNLTVDGTGTAGNQSTPLTLTVSPVGNFALTTTPATNASVAQSSNTDVTVNVNRTGGFTGTVALTVTGLVTGLTVALNPANVTGNSSTLTLTAAAGLAVGAYPIVIHGNSAGLAEQVVNLTVNVTVAVPVGNFTLTTTPATNAGVTQGTNTDVTVNVNRTGGFTGTVALTVTGLVTGLTVALNPASVTSNSSTLTLTATAGLAVGTYGIVIHGNTAGLAEQVVNLNVNVSAPSGSGNVTVTFAGCGVAQKAVWVAFQDGTGAWTRVTGTNDVYQFNITQGKAGVAYVTLGTGSSSLYVFYFSQAELTVGPVNFCLPLTGSKTLNGTVANLTAGTFGLINFGGSNAVATTNGAFQIPRAKDGLNDLVAWMHSVADPTTDRGFINRGLNPPDGGSLGTVDFTGANSFAPLAATANVTNTLGGGETLTAGMNYYTGTGANACTLAPLYTGASVTTASFAVYGVPAANQVATDYHSITIFAHVTTTGTRILQEDFQNLTTRAGQPFALPAALAPTVTDAGGPYKRLMLVLNRPAEYNLAGGLSYFSAASKVVLVHATNGWLGGSSVTLTVPDFSALAGWNNAWVPATSDAVTWAAIANGQTGTACQNGHRFVATTVNGTA